MKVLTKVQNIGGGGGGKVFAGCKLIGAPPAPNQCQMIIFLTLKTDDIANKIKNIIEKSTFRNAFE